MGRLTLKQAAAWCGGYVEEKYENVTFLGANMDTRILKEGQLFLALQGARDGHDFIPAAMERGAAAVLCSRKVGDYPAIYVSDPRKALGDIARQELRRIGCKVVGITGSVGKSTTKEMIAAVLSRTYRVSKTPANHNNDIGMPMAVLSMAEDTQVAVLEMGMNHFREMAYLSSIAQPDVGVIVNIGTMHIEFLGSVEGIRQAKLEILEGMAEDAKLLLNGDDTMLYPLPKVPAQPVTYFGKGENCAVRAENVTYAPGEITMQVSCAGCSFPVVMALEGAHFVPDAMAAAAVGMELGVPAQEIAAALGAFENMAGRQEIFDANGRTIIKDCYNAGPESMQAALNVLAGRQGRKIAVLGDMLELGDHSVREHVKLGAAAAQKADFVLAYGAFASHVVEGALSAGMKKENAAAFSDHAALASTLKQLSCKGDVLLFKGSHGVHMEIALEKYLAEEKNTTEE